MQFNTGISYRGIPFWVADGLDDPDPEPPPEPFRTNTYIVWYTIYGEAGRRARARERARIAAQAPWQGMAPRAGRLVGSFRRWLPFLFPGAWLFVGSFVDSYRSLFTRTEAAQEEDDEVTAEDGMTSQDDVSSEDEMMSEDETK
jgi:hypothetical protein